MPVFLFTAHHLARTRAVTVKTQTLDGNDWDDDTLEDMGTTFELTPAHHHNHDRVSHVTYCHTNAFFHELVT